MAKLHIRDDVTTASQPQHRIPYHMKIAVSTEQEQLIVQDIIEPVRDQRNPYIYPIVYVPKQDGGTRIFIDM